MFRYLVLIIGFCIPFSVTSTAQKVVWSSPLSESSKMVYPKVIGQNENGIYLVRSNHPVESEGEMVTYRNSRFIVSYFDYDMRQVWERTVEQIKKDTRIICFISTGNVIREISSEWNKTDKEFRLVTRSFNDAGTADTSYSRITKEEIQSVEMDAPYFIVSSQDKNYFLIAYQIKSENTEQRYSVLVCDASLNVVKKSTLTVPLSRKYFNPYQFMVSNSGNAFLFGGKVDSEKRGKDIDRSFFTLHSNTGNGWTEHEIRGVEHFLTDAGAAIDELNHQIVIAGFYSDKTDFSSAGVFYYHLDPYISVKDSIHFSWFGPGFLYNFLAEQKANYNRELVNYSIDRIILRRDGGAVIIAEANYTTDYSYYDYYLRTYIARQYYHRDNVVLLSVNKDGTLLWSDVIKKAHTTEDSDNTFISYAAVIASGKIHCIHNRFLRRKTQVLQNSTDVMGNDKSSPLFTEDQDVYIMPSAAKQVDESMLVIPAFKGRDLRLAAITF